MCCALYFGEKESYFVCFPILISAISHKKKARTQRQDDMSAMKAFPFCFIPISLRVKHGGLENFSFVKSEFRCKSFDYVVIITFFLSLPRHVKLECASEKGEIVLFQSHVKYEILSIKIDNAIFFVVVIVIEKSKRSLAHDRCGDNV